MCSTLRTWGSEAYPATSTTSISCSSVALTIRPGSAKAPNRFDKDAVKDIMFGRDDTKKDSNGVTVIPYSKLDERAPVELAA